MSDKKQARILFFIEGAAPTAAEFAAAEKIDGNVSFRNALHVPPDAKPELCDGVAGKVPPVYEEAYPSAGEAVKTKKAENANKAKTPEMPAPITNLANNGPTGRTPSTPQDTGDVAATKAQQAAGTASAVPVWGSQT